MNCVFCQREISETKIQIRDECPGCGGDLHICLHCEFYDAAAYQQCRESIREPVRHKDKANYCDFFRLTAKTGRVGSSEEDTLSKLHDLFK